MLTHTRHQFAVGQGCFHAGTVGPEQTTDFHSTGLLYVYDCGALSLYDEQLTDAVRRFHASVGPRRIDFLFLSHLHADHVSGVERLCSPAGNDIGTVVLPLLNDVDRLISFARSLAEDPAGATADLQELVLDPVGAISRRLRPQQIILVRRGEGPSPGSRDGGEPAPRRPDGPRYPGPGESRDTSMKWHLIGEGRVDGGGAATGGRATHTQAMSTTRIFAIDDTFSFELLAPNLPGTPWILAPYVDEEVSDERESFIRHAANNLGINPATFESWAANAHDLLFLVTQCRAELAAAYKAVAGLNVTSLSLLSAPYDIDQQGRWRVLLPPPAWRFYSMLPRSQRLGWLGTGDAALKKVARCERLFAHYGLRHRQISTLLLPHHGSAHNFRPTLLDHLNPSLCLAAADAFSNWQHPGAAVVQAANSRGCPLWVVTGDLRSEIHENVWLT